MDLLVEGLAQATDTGKLMSNSMGRHFRDDSGKPCHSFLCQMVCRDCVKLHTRDVVLLQAKPRGLSY